MTTTDKPDTCPPTCALARAAMHEALDAINAPELPGAAARHLAACPACHRMWDELRDLERLLRAMGREDWDEQPSTPDFAANVMAAIAADDARISDLRAAGKHDDRAGLEASGRAGLKFAPAPVADRDPARAARVPGGARAWWAVAALVTVGLIGVAWWQNRADRSWGPNAGQHHLALAEDGPTSIAASLSELTTTTLAVRPNALLGETRAELRAAVSNAWAPASSVTSWLPFVASANSPGDEPGAAQPTPTA